MNRTSRDGLSTQIHLLPRLLVFLIKVIFPSTDTCLLNYWLLSSEQLNLSLVTLCFIQDLTEDYSLGDSLSYNFEELLQRRMVLSTVLYLVRTKNMKQVRDTFLQGFKNKQIKNQTSMYTESIWPWHL